ncbi:zinc-binding dehydrogenase [Streptomyces sp. SID3343]|uniref:zinc-binding dehydrogenase n=1 Tax=Streptomyces sp. SID3343 TaxID=2690260 RepID=UPI001370288E|nr:zinc-binding dehydrogenase [Streptomyces sp. SID3343]MYW04125.1 zinc-binding dehydrogenase [Streptomyces sp. SID3343]
MRAVRLYEFGDAGKLRFEEVADPVPAAGQVLIDVQASGVHWIETTLRRGVSVGPHAPPVLPTTPGAEVAGVVGAVGPDVAAEWLGRRVVAQLDAFGGGYAERAVTSVASLHSIPDHLDVDHAVAAITTGATAQGVLDVARLSADDVVLVMSAAGGLGSLFVQAARRLGAVVVGVAGGAAKVERVRALGADVAVDYRAADWPDRVRDALGDRVVSVVLDGVGGASGRQALELLGPGGRFLLYGWASGEPTEIGTRDLIERQLSATWAIGPNMVPAGGMRELVTRSLEAAAAGRLVPTITRFPLSRAADAHAALEAREAEGKVVLTA